MKRKKMLQGLVALGILAAANAPAYAMQEEIVSYGGYDIFKVQYFDQQDKSQLDASDNNMWRRTKDNKLVYDGLSYMYNADMKKALQGAFGQWAEILYRNGKNMISPACFLVGTTSQKANANASCFVYEIPEKGKFKELSGDYFLGVFQNGFKGETRDLFINSAEWEPGIISFGRVRIGQNLGATLENNGAYYGWVYEPLTQQSQSESAVSLQPVIFHEIAHSIGILTDVNYTNGQYAFFDLNKFASHLVDQRGIPSAPDRRISWAAEDKDNTNVFYVEGVLGDKLQAGSTSGRIYFKGENVSQVLKGNGEYAKDFQGMDGIPILAWEPENKEMTELYPEFSHINLARSLMSHQNYRSYNNFIEAELAIMQDIGYDIDRRNFFGRSIYSDGNGTADNPLKNTQGYFARNAAGTAYETGRENTAALGVGLHVYGSGNYILQTDEGKGDGSADLLACGTGGAGIRIDGVGNTVTVDKGVTVSADGENGRGVLVAYGNNNNVVIDGTVTAAGAGGDGVRFDFGSNSMGGNMEYRGSYLRYARLVDENNGSIANSKNVDLNSVINLDRDSIAEGDLAGPMGSLTVNGNLYGRDHAVYIAKNAFVDKIAVNDGARISGDIVSDWKHFDNGLYDGGWGDEKKGEKLKIVYGAQEHYYDEYHKELVTQLNFTGNTEMQGNISGSDNMKMTVNSGTLLHEGSADVVNVKVNEGATLLGGSYKVNKIPESRMAGDKDTETGIFYNHGTIGALNEDSKLSIDGTLESDGRLLAYNGGSAGYIEVSKEAKLLAGSEADVVNVRPGDDV
ncbi:MAG: hypothetical protein MSS66_07000, partial [Selenomonadaceae bacterium]|nr:hypothetical protein [Selenomonadaceae bacterium]